MKRLLLLLFLLPLACADAPQTGSCQYYHYHDYWTTEFTTTTDDNGDSHTTSHETLHHDYICDRNFPLPSDDHGDIPAK